MLTSPAGVIRRRAAGAAIVLAAALLAGCSSSGSGGGGSSDTAAPSTSTAPTSAAAASTTPAAASSTAAAAPALSAAEVKAIKKAYVTFFNSKTKLSVSAAFLQHGNQFMDALVAQSKNPAAKGLSVTVSKVVPQSAVVAVATFNLVSAGQTVLTDTPGYAVKDGGKWKVAAGTFCGLLKLQNSAPKLCDQASITAFPSG